MICKVKIILKLELKLFSLKIKILINIKFKKREGQVNNFNISIYDVKIRKSISKMLFT